MTVEIKRISFCFLHFLNRSFTI